MTYRQENIPWLPASILLSHGKYNRTRELASPRGLCRDLKGKGKWCLFQERDFRAGGLGCTICNHLFVPLLRLVDHRPSHEHVENLLKDISSTVKVSASAKVTANRTVDRPVRLLALGSAVVRIAGFDIKTWKRSASAAAAAKCSRLLTASASVYRSWGFGSHGDRAKCGRKGFFHHCEGKERSRCLVEGKERSAEGLDQLWDKLWDLTGCNLFVFWLSSSDLHD